MDETQFSVVVGLGNPGREYAKTRHNIGFLVVELLRQRFGFADWRDKFGGEFCGGRNEGVVLFRPLQFMNLAGRPVAEVLQFYKIKVANLIVVHDELDLAFAVVRVKQGGGHGGHNGLRSLIEQLGADFVRIRCGIGRPAVAEDKRAEVTDYVLGPFDKAERPALPDLLQSAAEAVEQVLRQGVSKAMNRVNRGGNIETGGNSKE